MKIIFKNPKQIPPPPKNNSTKSRTYLSFLLIASPILVLFMVIIINNNLLLIIIIIIMRPLAGTKQLQYLCVGMYVHIWFLPLHIHVHIHDIPRFFISDYVFFELEITVLVMYVHFFFLETVVWKKAILWSQHWILTSNSYFCLGSSSL